MKNKIKAALAATLAAIITLTGLSSFSYAADTEKDTLIWDYYNDIYEYEYAGEFEVDGSVTLDTPEGDVIYNYYTINVEKAGFYALSYTYGDIDMWSGIPEYIDENGVAYNEADYIGFYDEETDNYSMLYYLEQGETVLAADITAVDNEPVLSFDFYGEEIESITFGHELIIDYDIYFYDNGYDIYEDVTLNFDSGKSFTESCIRGYDVITAPEGKHTLNTSILGQEFAFEIDACYITKYIKNAEIKNIDNYLDATVYYGSYDCEIPEDEDIVITFADGSTATETLEYGSTKVTLPNGKEVYLEIYSDIDNNEQVTIEVFSAGKIIKTYDCNEKKASFTENISALGYFISYHISDVGFWLEQAVYAFSDGFIEEGLYCIELAGDSFSCIFDEISLFITGGIF